MSLMVAKMRMGCGCYVLLTGGNIVEVQSFLDYFDGRVGEFGRGRRLSSGIGILHGRL